MASVNKWKGPIARPWEADQRGLFGLPQRSSNYNEELSVVRIWASGLLWRHAAAPRFLRPRREPAGPCSPFLPIGTAKTTRPP